MGCMRRVIIVTVKIVCMGSLDESAAVAQKKLKKDMGMLMQYPTHLRAMKLQYGEHDKRCMMPIAVLRDSEE